jgi:hypothetical protein
MYYWRSQLIELYVYVSNAREQHQEGPPGAASPGSRRRKGETERGKPPLFGGSMLRLPTRRSTVRRSDSRGRVRGTPRRNQRRG